MQDTKISTRAVLHYGPVFKKEKEKRKRYLKKNTKSQSKKILHKKTPEEQHED